MPQLAGRVQSDFQIPANLLLFLCKVLVSQKLAFVLTVSMQFLRNLQPNLKRARYHDSFNCYYSRMLFNWDTMASSE